jgi:nucleoside-diphosphate-sugar epimerase
MLIMPGQNKKQSSGNGSTVVVLGHSGFIGGAISGNLKGHGYDVVGASSRECDLTVPGQAAAFFKQLTGKFTVVFCSGKLRTAGSGYETLTQNLAMAENFLTEIPKDRMTSLIFLSSTSMYGPNPEIPILASTPARPINYYDISKSAIESLLRLPGRLECPVSALRLPGVYGPGDCGGSVIGRFVARIRANETITLFGDGSSRRDFAHVDDVAEVVRRVVDEPFEGNLNVASGVSLTMLEIVETIGRSAGISPKIDFGSEDTNSPKDLVFDVSDLNARFPGLEFTSLETGTTGYIANLERVLSA